MEWLLDGLRDIWDGFVDFVFRQIEGAYELVIWAVTWVFDSLWAIVEYILDFWFGEEGIFWLLFDFVFWLIGWALWFIPDFSEVLLANQFVMEWSLDLISMLDKFIPVSEALMLFTFYVIFMFAVLIVRLVLKFIPGMGG